MDSNGFQPSHYQEAIFRWVSDRQPTKPDAIVEAVAGSGKTETLIRAAPLIRMESLFVAFSKPVADKLRQRLAGTNMQAKTVHALGMQVLARNLTRKPQVDESKYWELARAYVKSYPGDFKDLRNPVAVLNKLARFARLTLTEPNLPDLTRMANRYDLEFDEQFVEAVATLLTEGQREARSTGRIDFTDMVYLPNAWNLRPWQFPFVCVDEYQDLCRAQLELVLKCKAPFGRLLFVGDEHQAIMFFAGADARSCKNIHERLNAQKLPLSICYRCPRDIVAMAKELVPQIEARPHAPKGTIAFRDPSDLTTAEPGDVVLCRKNAPLMKQALRLVRLGVSVKLRGREVGQEFAALVRDIGRACTYYSQFPDRLRIYEQGQVEVMELRGASEFQIELFQDKIDALRECYLGFSDCTTIDQLASRLDRLFSDDSGDAVWFSTIHRWKGLEAERTWILDYDKLGTATGTSEEAQQERNLKYVAITRSLSEMYLIR